MRQAETELAARAAKTAPASTAPAVPDAAPTPAAPSAAPSVQAPSAAPPQGVQAPPLDPSVPPPDVPPPTAADAAQTAAARPVPGPQGLGDANAAPPTGAVAAAEPVPQALEPTPDPNKVAPANALPPQPAPEPGPDPTVAAARRFIAANMGDFPPEKLNMTHMPNPDVMSSPDGIKAAILQVADDNREAIEAARGTAASNAQLTGLAQDLSVNEDALRQVFDREFGPVADTAAGDQRRTIIHSARIIEQNTAGQLLALAGRIASGTSSAQDEVAFKQYADALAAWRQRLAGVSAEAGRNLQALGIKVGANLPPEVMDHIAQVLKQNDPDLQQVAKAIKLAGTPQGIANIVGGWAQKPLWQRIPGAAFGMLQRIFINGILSGPPTWLKIFTGNNFNLAVNQFDLFAAGIGRGMVGYAARVGGFPTAAEGATISDAVAHLHGVISGGADALRVAGRVLKTGESLDGVMRVNEGAQAGSYSASSNSAIFANELGDSYFGNIVKGIDTAIDAPGRIIGAVDEFTKTLGYRGYLTMMQLKEVRTRLEAGTLKPGDAESIMQDLMMNPSEEMQQAAEDWAHRMTFQTPFPEGDVGEAFQNVLNKAPVLRFIFPFMRTATNIFKQSMAERTPLAIFSQRIRAQIAAGGAQADIAKTRIATGTAIGGMLAWMAIHDRITGDAPKDAKERMAWQLDGRQPYSIRITNPLTGQDTWRSYAWFDPMATITGAVADIVHLQSYIHGDDDHYSMLDHDDKVNQAIAHVMASIIQNVGNKTFMQGAAEFSEMYNDPERAFQMWSSQFGASFQPFSGATKFVRNLQDPFMRQAFTLIDKVRDQLPTMPGFKGSQTLLPRLDVFGEPRTRQNGNEILGPLNPLPGSPSKKDPLTDEIQNLMEQTQVVPITMPQKLLALDGSGKGIQGGGGMRLTPEEYYDYVRYSRADPVFNNGTQTLRERMQQTMNLPVYKAMSPPERVELLGQLARDADRIGAAKLYRENTDFRDRMTAWTAEMNRQKLNR
jgi:hypothetical protein